MFKVICIDDKERPGDAPYRTSFRIIEGETYHVVEEVTAFGEDGTPAKCYVLQEDLQSFQAHEVNRFIPLSSIDERTIQKNRELDAIINLFTWEHSI